MSLYSRMNELRPLPTPTDYKEAHEFVDESFGPGGSWENVTTEFAQIPRSPELRSELWTLANYGFMLRDSELDKKEYEHQAAPFLVGRAFAQGFSQQLEPSQLLYGRKFTRLQAIKILNTHYSAQNFEKFSKDAGWPEETYAENITLFNSQYIAALGQYGLSRFKDGGALDYINKWAEDAYPADDRLSRAFSFGHGAMIICGICFQETTNNQLLDYGSQNVDLNKEVLPFLIASTGEDQ